MGYAKSFTAGFLGGVVASALVMLFFMNYFLLSPASQEFGILSPDDDGGENVNIYQINASDLRNEVIPKIFEETVPSVVHITTRKNATFHPVPVEGSGSGIILREDGYILTSNHVVDGSGHPLVYLSNGEEYRGEVVGRDPMTDVAVVKIPANNLQPARLGDSSQLNVGEAAIAIGNPFRFTNTLTVGVISAVNRSFRVEGRYEIEDAIQTDAAINPGNSGGPLLNMKGEVIGINTAIFSTTEGFMGIGLAIPVNTAQKVGGEIMERGKVLRPWMGIEGMEFRASMVERNLSIKEGALVVSVDPRGPSHGVLEGSEGSPGTENFTLGDVIVEIDGEEIENMDDVIDAVLSHEIGDEMVVEVYRGGEFVEFKITLEERPENL